MRGSTPAWATATSGRYNGRVSDEALRALARAARAREGDLEAGWAYARALERAGDRRGLFLELCRLARAGDPRADAALQGGVAGPGGGPAAPIVDLALARAQVVRVVEAPTLTGAVELLAARGERVLARAGDAVVVVDLTAGEVRGGFPCGGLVALRGDDVLHTSRDRRALVLRDLQGEVLARVDLPWPAGHLAVGRDRALVGGVAERGGALLALDVGADVGRVLWATRPEHRASRLLVAGGRGLRVTTGWRLEAYDLEAGAVVDLGRLFRTHERRWLRDVDLRADPDGGALVYRASYREEDDDFGPEESEVILGEVDLATGDARWRVVGHWATAGLWGAGDLVVVAAREGAAHALVGVERPSGRLRFESAATRAHAVAVAADVVVAAGVTPDGRRVALTRLDARGGRVLARHELDLGVTMDPELVTARAAHGPAGLQVVLVSEGVVAAVEVPA